VAQGLVLAYRRYSRDYVAAEEAARAVGHLRTRCMRATKGPGRGGEHHRQDQVVRAGDLIGSCRRRLAKAFSIRALSLPVPTNT
jgi:hypothetical protein